MAPKSSSEFNPTVEDLDKAMLSVETTRTDHIELEDRHYWWAAKLIAVFDPMVTDLVETEATVTVARALLWQYDVVLPDQIRAFTDEADAVSGDLEPMVGPLCDHLDEVVAAHEDLIMSTLTLDSVEVIPSYRGYGFGKLVAARALIAAGGTHGNTLVLALAGARLEEAQEHNRPAVKGAATAIIEAVGMTRLGDSDVFAGHPTLLSYHEALAASARL